MEEMPVRIKRRRPAVERKISEITLDDLRVSLIGKVVKVDKIDYIFWLDDGTGLFQLNVRRTSYQKLVRQ